MTREEEVIIPICLSLLASMSFGGPCSKGLGCPLWVWLVPGWGGKNHWYTPLTFLITLKTMILHHARRLLRLLGPSFWFDL